MAPIGQFKGLISVIVVAGIAVLIGLVIGSNVTQNNLVAEQSETASSRVINAETGHSPFVAVAQTVKPAVVNIAAKSVVEDKFHSVFEDDFWRRFFGMPPTPQPFKREVESLGSGFIITDDGYILTNNHVIRGASDIIVRLSDAKVATAEVIGADSESDVALLRIKADEPLPYLGLGNSDSILVGDWAIAVGNPFPQLGLDRTLTVGVISALGRSGLVFGGDENPTYQNYIQTDASINPGNSGGPLVDIHGNVIGINAAIVSPSGGNVGIGFAIPINLAKDVAEQLRKTGKIERGWLGILPEDIDATMAEALGLKGTSGVLIGSVEPGSPAEKAGLKVSDVIIEFNGKEVGAAQQFRFMVAEAGPGTKVEMKIIRDGATKTIATTLGNRGEYLSSATERSGQSEEKQAGWLGLSVRTFTQTDAQDMGVEYRPGALIDDIEPGSPADDAGMFAGDVILEIDYRRVENESDFSKVAKELKNYKKPILFLILRGSTTIHKAIRP